MPSQTLEGRNREGFLRSLRNNQLLSFLPVLHQDQCSTETVTLIRYVWNLQDCFNLKSPLLLQEDLRDQSADVNDENRMHPVHISLDGAG